MRLKEFRKQLLQNPEFKKEYYKIDLPFEISEMLIEARILKGATQEKLAKMIDTKQASIARAENGRHLPSLSFLKKIADVFNTYLIVRFAFMDQVVVSINNSSTNSIGNVKKVGSSENPITRQYILSFVSESRDLIKYN